MLTLVKWVITIIVVLFVGYIYWSDKIVVPNWIAPLFACALFGVWLMKDPNKRKKKFPLKDRKERGK
jgi:hypothetical protein